jgi:hypothetical protein
LPLTLKSIGWEAFADCPALTALAIPKRCKVHEGAFVGSKTQVREF